MDLNYVKRLVKLLSESDIDELEIEEEGKKVRLAKHRNNVAPFGAGSAQTQIIPLPAAPAQPSQPEPANVPEAPPPPQKFHEIKSPIVGTFYRAPAPDAAPFIQIGSLIEPGSILCIVEAMKLMNEIEADVSGKIVKIMVENGQPVEYDQTLFLVEKA